MRPIRQAGGSRNAVDEDDAAIEIECVTRDFAAESLPQSLERNGLLINVEPIGVRAGVRDDRHADGAVVERNQSRPGQRLRFDQIDDAIAIPVCARCRARAVSAFVAKPWKCCRCIMFGDAPETWTRIVI